MLATTRKKTLKKISEITFDLEIINPIESKNLFGGCDYCSNGWNASNMNHYGPENNYQGGLLDTVVVYNNNYFGNNFNDSSNHILSGGYLSDWNNYGGDNNGGAGYSGSDWQQYDNNPDSNYDGISDADDLDNNGIKDDCLLTNLPLKIEQQIGNMCAYNALTLAANLLGSNINLNQMTQNVAIGVSLNPSSTGNNNLQNLLTNGLNVQQTYIAINQTFFATNATNTNQIEAALCLNQPVLAQYNNHEIVIVGYNSNSQTFTVADSQWSTTNGYHDIGYGSINEVFILTGIKP